MKFLDFDEIVIFGRKWIASVLQLLILYNYAKFGGTDSNG
jgi:hypothetical protein